VRLGLGLRLPPKPAVKPSVRYVPPAPPPIAMPDCGDAFPLDVGINAPRAREHRPQPKTLPLRSEGFKAFVRAHPCHHCGKTIGVEAAHFAPKGDGGGMATKADDRRCVPQCQRCHRRFHESGGLPAIAGTCNTLTRAATERSCLIASVRLLLEWEDLRLREAEEAKTRATKRKRAFRDVRE